MFRSSPQPMWDLTIHPPFRPSVLAGTSMWDSPPIHPPSGPSVLVGTPPHVHPPQGSASSLTHRSVSSSVTICNSSSPTASRYCPLWTFPLKLPVRGFHTLIKNVSFSSPTDVRSHIPLPRFSTPQ